jgi:hypothetical protein
MRLLNAKTLGFEEFMNEKTIPKYAILSHTWGSEEVTYRDLRDGLSPVVRQKTSFTKIKWTCQQAKAEGLEFCWVDTCCIDKSSSAELSEAINSMFRWYSRSAVCYAYLDDVEVVAGAATDLYQSKLFTRGCRSSAVHIVTSSKLVLIILLRRAKFSSMVLLGCISVMEVCLQIHCQKSLAWMLRFFAKNAH